MILIFSALAEALDIDLADFIGHAARKVEQRNGP
jgi:hypothetical protein